MSDPPTCPKCKHAVATAVGGLCPNCLMQVAMDTNTHFSRSTMDSSSGVATKNDVNLPIDLEVTVSPDGSELFATTALQPGTRIGNFSVQRRLGEGGMGTVYEAHDEDTRRRVALKVLKHTLNTPESRKRFLREGRTAASVNHPNSVYVYGTDNIGGRPIISMELVAGGTLQDAIRRDGPMPIRMAVDAILQVIDGLEAAEKVGVLHRDIKPSNCFVDTNGLIKVGDFGLSVSTAGTEDSMVSRDNVVLGTPAFASPEQLRGDDLDVRSDIYSVGVTLFYLLTAQTPFKAKNMVQLLATVLEKPAPSVISIRGDVAAELSAAIQKCLAKNPSDRWKSYDDLRRVLRIHATETPDPPPLALRSLACLIDYAPVYIASITYSFLGIVDMNFMFEYRAIANLASLLITIAYFTLFETWFGTSPGKAMLGLRLIDKDRKRPPFGSVLGRASFFVLFPCWLLYGFNAFAPLEVFSTMWGQIPGISYLVLLAVMFSSARQRNGFAGWHDKVSGIRVAKVAADTLTRPVPKIKPEQLPDTNNDDMIGPYHVMRRLGKSGGRETVLAYDMRLLRRVWIRQGTRDTELSRSVRDSARPGRLRWLNGSHDDSTSWDAYESTEGVSLLNLIRQSASSWESVRGWLLDLATELDVAVQDGSLPATTGLRYVWITSDGKAKLLDFIAPELSAEDRAGTSEYADFTTAEPGSPQRLLREVAFATLSRKRNNAKRQFSSLPLHAVQFLQRIKGPQSLAAIIDDLKRFVGMPAKVSRKRRWAMFAVASVVPVFAVATVFAVRPMMRILRDRSPGIEIAEHFAIYDMIKKQGISRDDERLFGIFIADKYSELVNDPKQWNQPMLRAMVTPARCEKMEEYVRLYATADPNDISRAHGLYGRRSQFEDGPMGGGSHWALLVGAMNTIMFVSLPSIVAAVLFRGGFLMLLFQVVCVTKSGERAGRLRMLWRSIWWTMPMFAWAFGAFLIVIESGRSTSDEFYIWIGAAAIVAGLLTPLLSNLLLDRGIPDRLSGTYLVPR